jgi:hypothetical protein
MDMFKMMSKRASGADNLSMAFMAIAAVFALVRGTWRTILAGAAFVLMMLGALPRQPALAFLVGASVILLLQTRGGAEGFADVSGEKKVAEKPAKDAEAEEAVAEESPEAAAAKDAEEKAKSEKFAGGRKPMLPDNATRREPLELGKEYKLPNESDDQGYHMDSGTTFLNAYKALKPDQIAAMTRDTQELLNTQKSLVAMLDSFAPLMKDMGKITGFLGTK